MEWYSKSSTPDKSKKFITVSRNYLRLSEALARDFVGVERVYVGVGPIDILAIAPMNEKDNKRDSFALIRTTNGTVISCYSFIKDMALPISERYYFDRTEEGITFLQK